MNKYLRLILILSSGLSQKQCRKAERTSPNTSDTERTADLCLIQSNAGFHLPESLQAIKWSARAK